MRIISFLASLVFLIPAFTKALRAAPPAPFCIAGSVPARENSEITAFAASLPPADTLDEPVEIDLIVLYTPAALAGAGSADILEDQIQWALDEANYLYTNSGVNIHVNLIHRGLINYAESGSMATDWNLLAGYAGNRGNLSRAATLREHYKADIVFMITETDNFGAGGVADIATATGNVDHAYGIVRRRSLSEPVVLAHEIGHTLGGQHDREHATDPYGKVYSGAFPYSHGFRLESNGSLYVTIMAYQPGIHIPFFSNPNLRFEGVPLGIPAGQDGASDNARTFNQVAPYVARYRTALSRIEFSNSRFEASETNTAVTLRLNRSGDLSQSASVVLIWETDGSARQDTDYSRPASSVVHFPASESKAEVDIPLLRNDQTTGDRTIHLTLSSPSGQHGLGWQSSILVVIRDKEPSVAFDVPVTYARESARTASIPVTFTGGFGDSDHADIEVRLVSFAETAKPGTDFLFENRTITFTPAHLRKTLSIPIMDNNRAELDRSFYLTAGNATNEVRILDDERNGSFQATTGSLTNFSPALVVISAEGKVLLAGQTAEQDEMKASLVRLNPSGILDQSFHSPEFLAAAEPARGLEAQIRALTLQPDGKILAAGGFAKVDGYTRRGLVRLNADGTVDSSFDAGTIEGSLYAVHVLEDGRILIGGIFDRVNGEIRTCFACLNPDGTLSPRFGQQPRFTSTFLANVTTISEDKAGRIFVGGLFEKVNNVPQTNIVCITPDFPQSGIAGGEIDSTFNLSGGASGFVTKILPMPDGDIMVSGYFDIISKASSGRLARLNANGSVDSAFRPSSVPNGEINDIVPLQDGRVAVAGAFTKIGSAKAPYLAILNDRGAAETEFDIGAGPDDYCHSLALRGDGSLFVAGRFREFNHLPANGLAHVKFNDLKPRISLSTHPVHYVPPGSCCWWSLTISGYPAGYYEVQSSEDLSEWRTLERITLAGATRTIPFPFLAPKADRQFIRLKAAVRPNFE